MFKCLHFVSAPVYLKNLITKKERSSRNLRSEAAVTLVKPKPPKTKTYGNRAFVISAPSLWNALPVKLRVIEDFESFKNNLKTRLLKSNLIKSLSLFLKMCMILFWCSQV